MKDARKRIILVTLGATFFASLTLIFICRFEYGSLVNGFGVYADPIVMLFVSAAFFLFGATLKKIGLKSFVKHAVRHIDILLALESKIMALEHRVIELRSENCFLMNNVLENPPERTQRLRSSVSNTGIIINERAFLHDLANKIQILYYSFSSMTALLSKKQENEMARQIEIINGNIETITRLIAENRDYLIVSS